MLEIKPFPTFYSRERLFFFYGSALETLVQEINTRRELPRRRRLALVADEGEGQGGVGSATGEDGEGSNAACGSDAVVDELDALALFEGNDACTNHEADACRHGLGKDVALLSEPEDERHTSRSRRAVDHEIVQILASLQDLEAVVARIGGFHAVFNAFGAESDSVADGQRFGRGVGGCAETVAAAVIVIAITTTGPITLVVMMIIVIIEVIRPSIVPLVLILVLAHSVQHFRSKFFHDASPGLAGLLMCGTTYSSH